VRDAANQIVGAISVSSAAQYMDDERMQAMADEVRNTARQISLNLGWRDESRRDLPRAAKQR
jgi:DNA-binding IclR family transcriptional regulator